MKSASHLRIARVIAIVIVIFLSVLIFSIRNQAEKFAVFGYPGIFLISFLAYATVLLPAPGIAVVFTMGSIFHPLGVALSAGAGAALGETLGYMAGFSTQGIIENSRVYETFLTWMSKYGPITILAISIVPNPFFDIAGVVAGALKFPIKKFLFWCWVGETLKMCFIAYTGFQFLK
jgi:membrane protein YqaA with SNARE-associated domain